MWRAYDASLGVGHSVGVYLSKGGGNLGYTRGMVDAFLDAKWFAYLCC